MMNNNYIIQNEWSIIEEGFYKENVTASESIFSIGNGTMGQRANFEETYTGDTLQGNYIGGIYYPDKTRVGWWKNGYPEYFAKVLNAPNWIGIDVKVNGNILDLNKCIVTDFRRELNMKNGVLKRSFVAQFSNQNRIKVISTRFISLDITEIGAIKYDVIPLNFDGEIEYAPYLDAGIVNADSNYNEFFWEILDIQENINDAYILSKTLKTNFYVCTGMKVNFFLNNNAISLEKKVIKEDKKITFKYKKHITKGDIFTIYKYGGQTQSMNHPKGGLIEECKNVLQKFSKVGFQGLLEKQVLAWAKIWKSSDIVIEGDIKAQQAIRFNIFQLNQTYSGADSRLNIGPKGFTGEKYGGSTYWDTEAYCIPFYMCTKDKTVAKNLLLYRYNQLDKAIENAEKLGFNNGAALYPMVTMNGEESHNEWEITFEEIHRNGAMIYAIYNYVNYTGDYNYMKDFGIEIMISIAKFWAQRASFSNEKEKFVILGVTGPNEYENNVNNNFYTNYLAKWCLDYTIENLNYLEANFPNDYNKIIKKTNLKKNEIIHWKLISKKLYFPYSEKYKVYLQQDGFLDKELIPVSKLSKKDRPINQKWSWDRILRSPYIKQADVLQGIYFFENNFSKDSIKNHFDFYEPLTVHESSLSPCVHSILAAKIDRLDKAYEMYLRTSRLDLDDYNHEVHEGLHITSMAGTWLSIVQGFGGMRNFDNKLTFHPQIPKNWNSYSFKINYRGNILKVYVDHSKCEFANENDNDLEILVYGKKHKIKSKKQLELST